MLTDLAIRKAKSTGKLAKLSDGGGLQLWITPEGGKLWRLAYRFAGKQRKLSIGAYPAVSAQAARGERDRAKQMLRDGVDPAEAKRLAKVTKATTSANTFDAVADELIVQKERKGRAAATLEKTKWLLAFARPTLGRRPVSEITAAEVLAVLREVEKAGLLESARRLRSVVGEVFRYAIATARATNDPTFALRGALTPPTVTHRPAITEPKALGALLRAIDGFEGQPATHAALMLMALLFPRPGELRMAEWSEFDFDAAIWVIPAARTKMRRPHRVPLPMQAVKILTDLRGITGKGTLVFPGSRSVKRPISDGTLNAALRRLGYADDEMTAHGFRATASSLLNESGLWNPDAIERALAHIEDNDVRRAYARGEHWDERVKMSRWWADELDRLRKDVSRAPEKAA